MVMDVNLQKIYKRCKVKNIRIRVPEKPLKNNGMLLMILSKMHHQKYKS